VVADAWSCCGSFLRLRSTHQTTTGISTLYAKLLKTTAIITSLTICGLILFLIPQLKNDSWLRSYQYFSSNLNGTAKGTIVISDVWEITRRSKWGGDRTHHVISYAYEVNGRQYLSDLVNFKERSFENSYKATSRYPSGKEVLVWYDKDSPEIAVLEKSGPTPGLIFIAVMDLLISCVGFLINPLMWIAFGDKYRKKRWQR
jgi:hypothetical protein